MKIEILKEVTGTVDGFRYPEHIYYVNKETGKLVAFKKEGSDIVEEFANPMTFNKRGRKFEKVKK